MHDQAEGLAPRFHQEAGERVQAASPEPPGIPYTQLPDAPPDSPIAAEWNLYRRIIGGLLAEGKEGKWLLIKNEAVVGIWDTEAEAETVRLEPFLMQPVLMKQILSREPLLRIGYNRLCRT